jgi:hypothetical protein
MRRAWTTGWRFALRLLAVPLGLAGVLLLGWALIRVLLSLGYHQGWAGVGGAGRALHRCGGSGGGMGPVVSTATAEGPGQLAVAVAGAVALQGPELVAGCPGAADLVAGDCGLVSGARLEPTYDVGIDCDGWHLWLPA